ncbi:MAG: 4Fe-4S binding protein [Coriobacteriia bacterium]|nr:4Fe-4S binding protein [Coriobacteriia bacterium]
MSEMKWDITEFDSWNAQDFPEGMVGLEAGNAQFYATGGWRSIRPVWDAEACKDCMLCWINCPDSSIEVADGKMTGINYDHCKGCGVCVKECRFNALKMVSEHDHGKEGV